MLWGPVGKVQAAYYLTRCRHTRSGTAQEMRPEKYRVRVVTSNKLGAGTDAKVQIVFEDKDGTR
jgi:hypothetical protein